MDDLQELLQRLGDEPGAIPFSRLHVLSDLTGERLAMFQGLWETLPLTRRRWLVHALVDLAEASFQVNFDAIFRCGLVDPDAEVRAVSIDGLWECEETTLIGPLLSMLRSDPSYHVRASAASALGRYILAGELEKVEAPVQMRILTELLTAIHLSGESVDVRRRALESASYACSPDITDALELAYYDEDEKMRLSAIVGMGRSCDERWKAIVLEEMESESPAMRYEAVWASGELMLREAVPLLARLIDDPDRQVCNATIWALGQIGGSQAKQILLNAYEDADQDLEDALDEALAELALSSGELEFPLYEFDGGEDDFVDDDLYVLWPTEDEDEDEDEDDF